MADEFAESRAMRERFMRAAYDRRDPSQLDTAPKEGIMRDLGLDPDITAPNGMRDACSGGGVKGGGVSWLKQATRCSTQSQGCG
jgi:hypothetical protein